MPNSYTALLSGSYWTGIEVTGKPVFVTYSFPTVAPAYVAGINDPALTPAALASWQAFSAAEQQMARDALAEWGAASGITFLEVAPGQGDINFQKLDLSGTGYDGAGGIGYFPFGDWNFLSYPYFSGNLDSSGDVFMNSDVPMVYGTLLHEIGHALGLKHPTEAWTQWAADPPVVHDTWATDDPNLTIMGQGPGGTGHLTAIDIQAIQAIYGPGTADGTQVASWSWNAAKATLTQNGFATADAIRGTSVKDIINGNGGNDRLFGLAANDTLAGGAGADTLDGGAGSDRMTGGDGDDIYVVTGSGDKVIEAAGGGYDGVYSAVSATLAAEVEALYLLGSVKVTGNGNALDNALFAGGGPARLNGLAGNDYIVGGGAKDTLAGGSGSDLAYGGGSADIFLFSSVAEFGPSGAPDTIGDFSHAQGDRISLKPIDPDAVTAGDQKFTFIGTAAFTPGTQFQVRYEIQGGNTVVQIDSDRNGTADLTILLYGAHALVGADFLL